MARILIDANRYLAFYDTDSMRSLQGLLIANRNQILVTEQIVNETKRNRLKVLKKFIKDNHQLLRLKFPQHLLTDTSDDIELKQLIESTNLSIEALKRSCDERI